jgi:hypothetical protein
MKKLFIIFSVLIFVSCSKDSKTERNKFTDLYVETLLISAKTSLTDSLRKRQIDSLMVVNHSTEADFKSSVQKYSGNPEEWKDIYKEITDKIEIKKQRTK